MDPGHSHAAQLEVVRASEHVIDQPAEKSP
jgi:hypothetical protein